MRQFAISDAIHNEPWHKYPADVKAWIILLVLAISCSTAGCARQIAPMTAVTRAHVVGTAAVVESTTKTIYDTNGRVVGKEIVVRSTIKNAAAVDQEHKNKESDNRTKVGTEQAGRKNAELMARILMMGAQGYYSGGGIYSQGASYDPRCRGECGTSRPYQPPR